MFLVQVLNTSIVPKLVGGIFYQHSLSQYRKKDLCLYFYMYMCLYIQH